MRVGHHIVRARYEFGRVARRTLVRRSAVSGDATIEHAVATIERVLVDNVLPTWDEAMIDDRHGGFRIERNPNNAVAPPDVRPIYLQARMLWFYSRLSRSPYGEPWHRDAADHGARYLTEDCWDHEFGGVFRAVSGASGRPLDSRKLVYGHAFALIALCEYVRVTDSDAAWKHIGEIVGLLDEHALDREFGGYDEIRSTDWAALSPRARARAGARWEGKSFDTHLHLLEAFTRLAEIAPEGSALRPIALERVEELLAIALAAFVGTQGALSETARTKNWMRYERGRVDDQVSYGHDVELLWLLPQAMDVLGRPAFPLRARLEAIADDVVRFGFDHRSGAVAWTGYRGVGATDRDVCWWVQAEFLAGMAAMAGRFGSERCLELLHAALRWAVDRQIDWARGGWYTWVAPDGAVRSERAQDGQAAYHTARALFDSQHELRR